MAASTCRRRFSNTCTKGNQLLYCACDGISRSQAPWASDKLLDDIDVISAGVNACSVTVLSFCAVFDVGRRRRKRTFFFVLYVLFLFWRRNVIRSNLYDRIWTSQHHVISSLYMSLSLNCSPLKYTVSSLLPCIPRVPSPFTPPPLGLFRLSSPHKSAADPFDIRPCRLTYKFHPSSTQSATGR